MPERQRRRRREQRLEGGDDHPRLRAGSSATTSHRRFAKELDQILELARDNGAIEQPAIRQRFIRQWSRVQIQRINGLRTLSDALHGTKQAAALGPLNKMIWSEAHRDTMDLAMDVLGMDAQVLTGSGGAEEEYVPGYGVRRGRADYPVSTLQSSFFFSRSETIWGGAAEIQRNIVGERVLGAPEGAGGDGLTWVHVPAVATVVPRPWLPPVVTRARDHRSWFQRLLLTFLVLATVLRPGGGRLRGVDLRQGRRAGPLR